MKGKLTWIAALALALGLIASGCGGDDGNDTEAEATDTVAAESLTKAEFIEQGNEVCKEGNKKLQKAGEDLGQGTSEEELNAFVTDDLIPLVREQIAELRALGIPEGDEELVNGILDDAEADLKKLEADPSLIQEGQDESIFADVNKRLDEYGLTECAS